MSKRDRKSKCEDFTKLSDEESID